MYMHTDEIPALFYPLTQTKHASIIIFINAIYRYYRQLLPKPLYHVFRLITNTVKENMTYHLALI